MDAEFEVGEEAAEVGFQVVAGDGGRFAALERDGVGPDPDRLARADRMGLAAEDLNIADEAAVDPQVSRTRPPPVSARFTIACCLATRGC